MDKTPQTLLAFMQEQSGKLLEQSLTHIGLTFASLLLAVLIGLPLGILISGKRRLAGSILGFAGVLQTIPSMALLGFLIPVLGIGAKPAIAALFLYALLPIIRNTYTGLTNVDATVIDAARGMGMSKYQILVQVELPLALPVILAGVRTATVINVGVATLAAYIAAGGLGEFIFGGIALNNTNMILAGALPAALLAILFDFLIGRLQKLSLKKMKGIIWTLPVAILLLAGFYLVPPAFGTKLLAGFTPEFMGRQDGFLGLQQTYHLNMRNVVISDAVMYQAAHERELDVISGYSTDGRLKAFDLVILEDDKHIFPPYYAAPIIRHQALNQFPDLAPILNKLAGLINDSVMTELNYQVDYLKKSPEEVAKKFLQQHNLSRPPRNGQKGPVRIGSKIFGEQYILASLYQQLIAGYSDYRVETKTGLGGTKICFDALTNNQIDLYPEYTGTGLLVLLQPSAKDLELLGTSKEKTYRFVKKEFKRRYNITWLAPIGFNNAYALMMRREQAVSLGIKSISDLKNYIQKK